MVPFQTINMHDAEKTHFLEDWHFCDNLTAKQTEKLAETLTACLAPAGTKILSEGESNDFFCLLADGQVVITKENNAGKTKELQTLNPGKLLGEISFFDKGSCSASIIAKTDATLLIMEKQAFTQLSSEVPQIALEVVLSIITSISKRLRQTTGQLIDLL